jgi:hypothetical protein
LTVGTFDARFREMERLQGMSLAGMDAVWDEVKRG